MLLLQFDQPTYLRKLVKLYEPVRTLCSSNKRLLCIDRTETFVATRYFNNSSDTVWNSLPVDIRECNTIDTFKHKLKTYLFKLAFAT